MNATFLLALCDSEGLEGLACVVMLMVIAQLVIWFVLGAIPAGIVVGRFFGHWWIGVLVGCLFGIATLVVAIGVLVVTENLGVAYVALILNWALVAWIAAATEPRNREAAPKAARSGRRLDPPTG